LRISQIGVIEANHANGRMPWLLLRHVHPGDNPLSHGDAGTRRKSVSKCSSFRLRGFCERFTGSSSENYLWDTCHLSPVTRYAQTAWARCALPILRCGGGMWVCRMGRAKRTHAVGGEVYEIQAQTDPNFLSSLTPIFANFRHPGPKLFRDTQHLSGSNELVASNDHRRITRVPDIAGATDPPP
jgi:hypothetical protein